MPVVDVTGRRFSLNMISAVSPQGEFRFMLHEGSVTATVFRKFLKRLVQNKDEMKRLALGALRRIQRLPSLVKSFFLQPECQYALI